MSDEYTPEQELTLLEQDYTLLHETLDELRKKAKIETDYEEKCLIQRQIEGYKAELLEVKQRLEQLKVDAGLMPINKHAIDPAHLHGVPDLPTPVLTFSLFAVLKSKLMANPSMTEIADGQKNPLVVYAPNGGGKSMLATSLAHDLDIRRAFMSGVFWVNMGQEPDLVARQTSLVKALNGAPQFVGAEAGTAKLQELCTSRACLVILDDVWDVRDVLPFGPLGRHCQLLITTGEATLLDYVKHFMAGAQSYTLEPLEKEQAIAFFAEQTTQSPATLPLDALKIAKLCGYLPLTLQLVINVVHVREDWKTVFEQLQRTDCKKFPDTLSCLLTQAFHLNVEMLSEENAEQYLTLAVFVDHADIPIVAIALLWRYLYHHRHEQIVALLKEWAKKGLLFLKENGINLRVFQYHYLSHHADLEKLHEHLLAAYRRHCGQRGWISGPNDGYFFQNLCLHLHAAKRDKELKSLLLDFDWIQTSLEADALATLLRDYTLLEDQDLVLIGQALEHAVPVLLKDKNQLATQLLNYLRERPSLEIQKLLNQAKELAPDWQPPQPNSR